MIPAVLKQVSAPAYHVKRPLPNHRQLKSHEAIFVSGKPYADGWTSVCSAGQLGAADVLCFDYGKKTFVVYRDAEEASLSCGSR